MQPRQKRWRRWSRRALLLVLSLEALYLVAGNYYLNSSRLLAVLNQRPERFSIRWRYGWTPWPGSAYLHGVEMRGTSRVMEWYARLDAISASFRVIPLFEQTVHLRNVSVRGIDYRQRRRLEPGETAEVPESLPPLPAFEVRMESPSQAAPSVNEPREPWTIVVDRIDAGLEQVWIDRYRLAGTMNVETSMNLVTRGPLGLPRIRFTMSDGALTQGDRAILGGLRIEVETELSEFVPGRPKGMDFIRLVSGRFRLSSDATSIFFLEPYFEKVPWLHFGGQSSVRADLSLRDGVLQPGSTLDADLPAMNTRFLDRTLLGQGRIQARVEEAEGGRRAEIQVLLDDFALAASAEDEPYARGHGFKVVARSRSLDLDDPFTDFEVTADLPEAVIPDLAWYNRYVPPGAGIEFRSGQGRIEYHVEASQEERSLHGRMLLTAENMGMRIENYEVRGDIKVDMSLRGTRAGEGLFDVSGTTIDLTSDNFPWQATVLLQRAEVRFSEPMTVDAELAMTMTDTTPLVAMFDAQKDISGFVEKLMMIRDIRSTAACRVDEGGVQILDVEVKGEDLQILADLALGKSGRNGILYIKYHIFSVGVEMRDGKKNIDLVRARKWFEKQRALRRAPAGASKPRTQ